MPTNLVTDRPWSQLTASAKRSRGICAVAYFGRGASKLLPLKSGSILVVDASERAVRSGQTSPADLLNLIRNGVKVFSVGNLHAKVYAFSGVGFVGSTNVSRSSADGLVEAIVRSTDRKLVAGIRAFVRGMALEVVGPEYAKKLSRLYRPPKFGHARGPRGPRKSTTRVQLATLRVLRLEPENWDSSIERTARKGRARAKKKVEKGALLDEIRWSALPIKMGEQVVQSTDENGTTLITAPGRVVHMEKVPGHDCDILYVEVPPQRRKSIARIRSLGGRALARRLCRGGKLSPSFARGVMEAFA